MAASLAGERPRISANAFRSLTARLKKAEVPDIVPVPVAAPAPLPTVSAAPAAPVSVAPVAPAPAVAVAPAFVPNPEVTVPPAVDLPAPVPPTAPAAVEAAAPVAEEAAGPQEPFVPEPEEAALQKLEQLSAEEARLAVARVREAVHADQPAEDTRTDEERIVEENWRLLLAYPTAEDRAQFLREAREMMEEEGLEPLAAEFDLSRVVPADAYGVDEEEPLSDPVSEPELDEPVTPAVTASQVVVAKPALRNLAPADEQGDQDTAEIARSLLDMMASGSSSGLPHERALAADTLLRLVPKLDTKPLIMLAERVAKMDQPPALLVARLIRDPRVEVSGPLLEDCMHITDRDLQAVVEEHQPDKLRMVARRRRLSRTISDALIHSAEPSVLLTLVRNMEAEISHEGFLALMAAAASQQDLLAPLSTRTDISAPFAFELFWLAPAALRRYLLSRFLTDSETLTKILKITLATRDDENVEAEPFSQHAVLEALERASRGKVEQAADELGGTLQIAPATAMRVLHDTEGEPLVILLKAAGYARSAVKGLLSKMQQADVPLISPARDLEELQYMFETLSFNKARILLTYWDWAQRKQGPYAPVH